MTFNFQETSTSAFGGWVECTLNRQADGEGFTLSVIDQNSGAIIGRRKLPANSHGMSPALTIADALEVIGDFYGYGDVQLSLVCHVSDAANDCLSDRLRRDGSIRPGQPRRAAA